MVTNPANPDPAGEPDTVFEPATGDDAATVTDARRRGVNLASHTGVGIAGAAGMLGVQRFGNSGGTGDTGAAGLDVFHETDTVTNDGPDRGVTASAGPVIPQEPQAPSHPPPLAGDVQPVHIAHVSEPVEFLPVTPDADLEPEPDMLADFSPAVEETPEPPPEDETEAPAGEPDESARHSSLADAGTEIGGGVTLDDVASAGSLFGATSEFGVVVEDDADDDDENYASIP